MNTDRVMLRDATLEDFFAAQAMKALIGLMAHTTPSQPRRGYATRAQLFADMGDVETGTGINDDFGDMVGTECEHLAYDAYLIADAMMLRRARDTEEVPVGTAIQRGGRVGKEPISSESRVG
jgi:hypothetical protein